MSFGKMSVEEFMKAVKKDSKSRPIKSYGEVLNERVKKKLKRKGIKK